MKKIIYTLSLFILFLAGNAQAPQLLNYQAIARNNGTILANQAVGLQFIIHDQAISGAAVYSETQTATTNQYGLFTVKIGAGTSTSGTSFNSINWSTNSKYLEVDIDPTGGSSYAPLATTQLISVPYALYANKADTALYANRADTATVALSASNSWNDYAIFNYQVGNTLINLNSGWNYTTPIPFNQTETLAGTAISRSYSNITLAPGSYYVNANAVIYNAGACSIGFYDGTNIDLYGVSGDETGNGYAFVSTQGVITIQVQTTYTLIPYVANSTGSLGSSAINGGACAQIFIQKIK